MQIYTPITLDLQHGGVPPLVAAKQNDRDTRGVIAALYSAGVKWEAPADALPLFRYKKADGTAGWYDKLEDGKTAAITVNGNVVTVLFAEQVLAAAGDTLCELHFYNAEGQRLTAFSFTVNVQPCALADAEIVSSDYYNILSEQVRAVLNAEITAASSAAAATKAATAASTSAVGAQEKAAAAEGSASAAKASETSAAASAEAAASKEATTTAAATAAEASKKSAAGSATTATQSASAAAEAKAAAKASAAEAAGSAETAAQAALAAKSGADEAAASASQAQGVLVAAVKSVNGIKPDPATGDVPVPAGVAGVCGVKPDSAGDVQLKASHVGAYTKTEADGKFAPKTDSTLTTASKLVTGAINEVNEKAIANYTHTYDAATKVHNLVPAGDGTSAPSPETNGKMLVTAAMNAGDTFAVNGKTVPAYAGEDAVDELPVGRWVTFVFDGAQLNFNWRNKPKKELLWENASPLSTFPPQTISFSKSLFQYKFLGISYFATSSSTGRELFAIFDITDKMYIGLFSAWTGGAGVSAAVRDTSSITEKTIEFKNAARATGATAAVTDNTFVVPVRIYGFQ